MELLKGNEILSQTNEMDNYSEKDARIIIN